jgi:TatD DNase family protein
VIDSHAHLDSCDAPVAELLDEAVAADVSRVVTIGVGRESSESAVALAERHSNVFAAVGVHPLIAADAGPDDDVWIRRLAEHPRVVAVGECGLDYFRDGHAPPAKQEEVFRAQIEIARDTGLPLVIHTRAAARPTLDILASDATGVTVVLHCFSLVDDVDEVMEAGYFTSIAGQLTYPKATDLHDAVRRLPLDRLMVETDSPYLSPVPRRGRPNRPANTAHTLRFLADLHGVSPDEMDRVTTANTLRAFPRMAVDA